MPWEELPKPAHHSSKATVTIRSNLAIAISGTAMRAFDLEKYARASVLVDREVYAIGLRFHSDELDDSSYALIGDGGGKSRDSRGKVIQAISVLRKVPFVVATVRDGSKRFPLRRENDLLVIDVGPGFQEVANYPADVPSEVEGVYRYIRSDEGRDEVVYIGRGRVRSRMQDPQREAWRFDRVEWSAVDGIEAQTEWEAVLIEAHKKSNSGRLPEYNKVSGSHSKA